MMSQARAISKPPPRATPFTAAITGLNRSCRSVMPPKPPLHFTSKRSPEAAALRSLPAEKARSPAPVMMATQASSSAAKASKARPSSALAGGCSAFMRSGRSMVMVVMRSRVSTRMYW